MKNDVVAVVLAAGRSRRMGQSKQLLPLGGKTVLYQVLNALSKAKPADIFLVLGTDCEEIADSSREFPVRIILNETPGSEMADSLKAATVHLPSEIGVMVCLADQPMILPETYRLLIQAFRNCPETIWQPRFAGRRGHPVLLPSELLGELAFRPTLRNLLAAYPHLRRELAVDDPGVLMDMDTPDDFRRVQQLWEKSD